MPFCPTITSSFAPPVGTQSNSGNLLNPHPITRKTMHSTQATQSPKKAVPLDMVYDRQVLTWNGHGAYKASSGMIGFQKPRERCVADRGPIPTGVYSFALVEDKKLAQDDGTGICQLRASPKIQRIPRGAYAGDCEPYWALWGVFRVRLEPLDRATNERCKSRRGGFYLHDSIKGFSHGCIEVETKFFTELLSYLAAIRAGRAPRREKLVIEVRYVAERTTNGGTKKTQ